MPHGGRHAQDGNPSRVSPRWAFRPAAAHRRRRRAQRRGASSAVTGRRGRNWEVDAVARRRQRGIPRWHPGTVQRRRSTRPAASVCVADRTPLADNRFRRRACPRTARHALRCGGGQRPTHATRTGDHPSSAAGLAQGRRRRTAVATCRRRHRRGGPRLARGAYLCRSLASRCSGVSVDDRAPSRHSAGNRRLDRGP